MSWRHHNDYTKTHDDVINGNIFRVTGHLWWESTGHRWIPLTKASDAELWFFFYLRLNKLLSKQSRRRWFETPLHSLWRHCNDDFTVSSLCSWYWGDANWCPWHGKRTYTGQRHLGTKLWPRTSGLDWSSTYRQQGGGPGVSHLFPKPRRPGGDVIQGIKRKWRHMSRSASPINLIWSPAIETVVLSVICSPSVLKRPTNHQNHDWLFNSAFMLAREKREITYCWHGSAKPCGKGVDT